MIEAAADAAVAEGRLKPRQRRRIMSYPLVIRLMIAMTLMPDASCREALGAVLGQPGAGEQTLLRRLVKRRPGLFAGRVTCFDRNFPGHDLITAILQAGGHVIARVKEGIPLPLDGPDRGWLPDGSRMTWLNAPSGRKTGRLPVRAAEHNVILPSGDRKEEPSETCTVITTLLDHRAAPADHVRDTYLTRRSASGPRSANTSPRSPSPGNPRSPYSRPDSHSPRHTVAPGKGGTAPSPRGRGPWNRAPPPPRHAGVSHARALPGNRCRRTTRRAEVSTRKRAEVPCLTGFRVGPGPPARRLCGAELAVQGAFGVADAMGFAHPGPRSLPRGLAGYRVAPADRAAAGETI